MVPADPPATGAVGESTGDQARGDGGRDATVQDEANTADSPLPRDRRPARVREQTPRANEEPPRAQLPPLDYSKRRPSLPPRARTE
jgi:hypothetical protein